jgi:indolepyruvate ferredoxin oxidoreductase
MFGFWYCNATNAIKLQKNCPPQAILILPTSSTKTQKCNFAGDRQAPWRAPQIGTILLIRGTPYTERTMKHALISLEDKYATAIDRVYLTGTQALVRLPLLQRELDKRAGLNTACFISGYRGSPLGQLDIQLWQARKHLMEQHIHFQPGLNEELAATAMGGSQQVPLYPGAKYDGVFALWYGKGPGVDRSCDAIKHANFAGTSAYGGVLIVAGDDHGCKSSTLPHQSEPALIGCLLPVLVPANVHDLLELGLHGWAVSRYSGLFVGFKTVADVVDSSSSVTFSLDEFSIRYPNGERRAPGNLGIQPNAWAPMEQEHRIHAYALPAVQAYVRENGLDRIVRNDPAARFGIITAGKSWLDVRQALADLELEDPVYGIRLLKLALTWPLEPATIRQFASGLEEILVVEEKAPIIENQVKAILYSSNIKPRVVGKQDEKGALLLSPAGEYSAADIAIAIAKRLAPIYDTEPMRRRLAFLQAQMQKVQSISPNVVRRPYFCSGCPHNTSTKVIEGSRAMAGIGCHFMARWMDRQTDSFAQMGGEGAAWIGQAPFTEEKHVFVNLGDGTYVHSGILAIRAAVAAGVNVTYKILFNDAVAMTGGQPAEGKITVPQITRQLAAEGVRKIYVVTDEPEKYKTVTDLAPGVPVRHRRDLLLIEQELREIEGVTAILYDQTCATEKRRRRKRGLMEDPPRRAFINARVCEGCGDCSTTSNCLSVVPLPTPFGLKRAIDQSSCNKDFSCIEGFCPSFVTVHGGKLRRGVGIDLPNEFLPEPELPSLAKPYGVLVAGVGGTGVITIGALLGVAAHAEGKHVTVLDQLGLAQKGGSVWSHIKIAATEEDLRSLRVGAGGADLLLACDLVVGAGAESLIALEQGHSRAVVNTHDTITADFIQHPGTRVPTEQLKQTLFAAVGEENSYMLDATALATALVGDAIGSNVFLLGFAYQRGLIPVGRDALLQAIELNGTAVEMNKAAFEWGRLAAVDLARVTAIASKGHKSEKSPQNLDEWIAYFAKDLVAYQNRAYERRYRKLVDEIRAAEERVAKHSTALTMAVARNFYKLMAYKDEYEVARLYTDGSFRESLQEQFEGDFRLEFHLAPPLLAKRDPRTGHLLKRGYGPWMMPLFRLLRYGKFLRGTRFDIFGRTEERQTERRLISEYEEMMREIARTLRAEKLEVAIALASLPARISGFGHIKERRLREVESERKRLLERYRAEPVLMAAE